MTGIPLRPATTADSEFCFQLHTAAMGDYIAAIWWWDKQVQRDFHTRAFNPHRWHPSAVSCHTQHLGDHRCSLQVASRIEQDLHGRQWQHGDPPATDDDSVHMVQVRSANYHLARRAHSLYALQDLDLDAVHHGQGPADGAHVATIPARLVAHHGTAQPVDQLVRGYMINQEIQVSRIDRQSMEGERSASTDRPPATSNNGQLAQGRTPRWR